MVLPQARTFEWSDTSDVHPQTFYFLFCMDNKNELMNTMFKTQMEQRDTGRLFHYQVCENFFIASSKPP